MTRFAQNVVSIYIRDPNIFTHFFYLYILCTFSSETRVVENGVNCNGEDICDEDSDNDHELEPRGPRITVPGAKEEEDEETEVKAIRGRRKPLYSLPALQRATKSGPPSPKISLTNRAVNGSPARSRLPHPPPLVREGNNSQFYLPAEN